MPDDKKLIIDEDWKSQVQAEKEAAAKSMPAAGAGARAPEHADVGDFAMPPATFEMLLTTLATEALVALGQVPHPAAGDMRVEPNQAKFIIDTIDVLREKTNGNLTPAEQQLLESLLHQLRMAFIEIVNQPETSGGESSQTSAEMR